MNLPNACPDCGTALPADAPKGFCPNCLFEMAVALPPSVDVVQAATGSVAESTQFGDYELLEELGRGGMGVVHKARQISLNRLVAVKLIKQGLDSSQVLTRFEAERQALALMDHPNIARVFEASCTAEGWPFFVMELVQGVPITRFCDEQRLSIRERLELFVAVCHAIQHAHQKGIIHRDIKPGNVLVFRQDEPPVPKVIDFGIAKAMGPRLTEETLQTELGAIIGTLEYMSPEQARLDALDTDTRSDIYALGILLYELLTGTTPLNRKALKQVAFDEVLRRIREEEPPRPSTRLLSSREALPDTAAKRSLEPFRLPRLIEGDVDWIVMKALEKNRERRYETANGLAQDILRHLHDEPVLAGPPTARYRMGKFVRKHRKAVAWAGAFVLLLTTAAIVSTSLAFWAERERAGAESARTTAVANERKSLDSEADTRAFADFLVDDVLSAARPKQLDGGLGIDVTVAKALEAASYNMEKQFAGRPKAEATARQALGLTWYHLDRLDWAERDFRRAVALREREFGSTADATLSSRNMLGLVLIGQGRTEQAIASFERDLREKERLSGPNHRGTIAAMSNLALAYTKATRPKDALPLFEEALRRAKAALGLNSQSTLSLMANLSQLYQSLGQQQKALGISEEVVKRYDATVGSTHPNALTAINNLAISYVAAGRHTDAMRLLEGVLQQSRLLLGSNHSTTLAMLGNLANAYQALGQDQDASARFEEVFVAIQSNPSADHAHILHAQVDYARSLHRAGRLEEALALTEDALQRSRKMLEPHHPVTLVAANNLAVACMDTNRVAEAFGLLEETLALCQKHLPLDHPRTLGTMNNLAQAHRHLTPIPPESQAASVNLLRQVLTARKANLPPHHPDTLQSLTSLADAFLGDRRWADALPLLDESIETYRALLTNDHPDTLRAMNNKAAVLHKLGRAEEAVPIFEVLLPRLRAVHGTNDPQAVTCLHNLASACDASRQYEKSLAFHRELLTVRERTAGPNHPDTLAAMNLLGRAHFCLRQYDQAIAQWEETLRLRRPALGNTNSDTLVTMHSLASAYKAAGRLPAAVPLLEELFRHHWNPSTWTNRLTMESVTNLVSTYRELNRLTDAELVLRQLLAAQRPMLPEDSRTLANTLAELGDILLLQSYPEQALQFLRPALAIREKRMPEHWMTSASKVALGEALVALRQHAEAEELLVAGAGELLQRASALPTATRALLLARASRQVLGLYATLKQPEKADAWRRKFQAFAPEP